MMEPSDNRRDVQSYKVSSPNQKKNPKLVKKKVSRKNEREREKEKRVKFYRKKKTIRNKNE